MLAGGQEVYIGTSIGICIFPNDNESVDQIIRNADAALYQAKGAGRSAFRFYTEALTVAANARVEMESALRRGLQRGEFLLHYQPLVAMSDCRIVGVEALVRWKPPGGEMIPAASFISVAEETGLIIPLGEWVLHAACAQMKRLARRRNGAGHHGGEPVAAPVRAPQHPRHHRRAFSPRPACPPVTSSWRSPKAA